jgi:CheY-like chemotaxis protein
MERRKTVLVVDDSQAVLDALSGALEDAGFEVASAMDGEEVFRKLSATRPDVLLVDVYMPKLNGADVCRLVKAHPAWKSTYLVIMSSRIGENEVESYRRMGADAVLRKPLDAPAVARMLADALG